MKESSISSRHRNTAGDVCVYALQLAAELEQNKSEKLQKEALKRFFSDRGFTSLDVTSLESSSTGGGGAGAAASRIVSTATPVLKPTSATQEWTLPDMFDAHVASYLNS